MENYETSLVADQYRVNRVNGGYEDTKNRTLVRKGMKVTTEYFEEVNSLTSVNGLMFIKDEEATAKRVEEQKENAKKRELAQVAEGITAKDLINELTGKSNNKEVDEELESLRAEYKELSGKDANKLWKSPKLTSEIAELKK
jgi:hypothetical protein